MKKYDYICITCNNNFEHRKSNRKYCSIECCKKDKRDRRKAICKSCNKEFFKYSSNLIMKYCSRICASKIIGEQKTLKSTFQTECTWCKKIIKKCLSRKGKTGNFCSIICGEAFKRGIEQKYIIKACKRCNKEYETLYRKKTEYCSRKCSSNYQPGEKHSGYGKEGPTKGIKPWTYGLKKETDIRILNLSEKIRKIHKEQFASGLRSNAMENNPNWGKKRESRTKEQLENYSKAAIKRIATMAKGGYIKGYYISEKAIKRKMYYRSSYELLFMKLSDIDDNVITYEYEPFYIKYNIGKRYLPDFIVHFKDGSKTIIEIKSDYTKNLKNFKEKEKIARIYCETNNMIYKIYTLEDIKEYEKKLKNLI